MNKTNEKKTNATNCSNNQNNTNCNENKKTTNSNRDCEKK